VKTLSKWLKQHFLLFDVVRVTLGVAVVVGLAFISIGAEHLAGLFAGIRTTLYGTASAGCAALLGFVITTATITDAVMQNPQWEAFRKSFAYSQVQDIYFETIRWLGLSTLVFLVFLIADTDAHPQLVCEVISAWLICVLTSRMWRSIDALETLLRRDAFKRNTMVR